MSTLREAAEVTVVATAPKATLVGAATMSAGWLTLDSAVTIIGALMAILGGWATWYFKARADRRAADRRAEEHAEHERRMQWLDQRIAEGKPITADMAKRARDMGLDVRSTDVSTEDE